MNVVVYDRIIWYDQFDGSLQKKLSTKKSEKTIDSS